MTTGTLTIMLILLGCWNLFLHRRLALETQSTRRIHRADARRRASGVLGWKGWLAPEGWHGRMPPISLIAVIAAVLPLIVRQKIAHERAARASDPPEST